MFPEALAPSVSEGEGVEEGELGWWLVRTVEEVVDIAGIHLCGLFMVIVWILRCKIELEWERKVDIPDARDMW